MTDTTTLRPEYRPNLSLRPRRARCYGINRAYRERIADEFEDRERPDVISVGDDKLAKRLTQGLR